MIYLVLVSELRRDIDRYNFSSNYACQTLEQAEARFDLQVRIHAKPSRDELVEESPQEQQSCGDRWLQVINKYTKQVQIKIELRTFLETYIDNTPPLASDRASIRTSGSHEALPYGVEHDKTDHIFVVSENYVLEEIGTTREDILRKPTWSAESIHQSSKNAVSRAQQIWKLDFENYYGPAVQYERHFGMYRLDLLPRPPHFPGERRAELPHRTGSQIRIDRVRITPPHETFEPYIPKEAILYQKPWQPLCPGREAASLQRYMDELNEDHDKALYEHYLPGSRYVYSDTQRAPLPTRRALERILLASSPEKSKRKTSTSAFKQGGRLQRSRSSARDLVNIGQRVTTAAQAKNGGILLKPASPATQEPSARLYGRPNSKARE